MLVFRIFDNDKNFITDHVITSETTLNEYVNKGLKLYNKENDEYYLWYDGAKWLFPKPSFDTRKTARLMDSDIFSVLQEINSKLDNLT